MFERTTCKDSKRVVSSLFQSSSALQTGNSHILGRTNRSVKLITQTNQRFLAISNETNYRCLVYIPLKKKYSLNVKKVKGLDTNTIALLISVRLKNSRALQYPK